MSDENKHLITYVCWNSKKHIGGTYEWKSVKIPTDKAVCPVCGEVVKITFKI